MRAIDHAGLEVKIQRARRVNAIVRGQRMKRYIREKFYSLASLFWDSVGAHSQQSWSVSSSRDLVRLQSGCLDRLDPIGVAL